MTEVIEERKEEFYSATDTRFFVHEESKINREKVMRDSLTNFKQKRAPSPAKYNQMMVDYNDRDGAAAESNADEDSRM